MSVQWNGEAAARAAQEEAARRLQRAVQWFWARHVRRLSVSNPRPYLDSSRPGEYPRKRTGGGISGVIWAPMGAPEIIAAGFKVRAGVSANARHLAILEFRSEIEQRRKGFLDTMRVTRDLIRVMLEGRTR